jgi:hypothetical protein
VARLRGNRTIIAVDNNYTIYSDDKAGKQAVDLRHLQRTGSKPQATLRCGMTKAGVAAWRREDPEFREKERDATYAASAKYINKINQAAMKGDTKAAIWLAEKLNPEEYGRNDSIQIEFTPPPRLARRNWSEIPTLDAVEGEYRDVPGDADVGDETPDPDEPGTTALAIRPLDP